MPGTRTSEVERWGRIVQRYARLVPPYPALHVVPLCVLPAPLELDPLAPLEERAERVRVALVGAYETRWRGKARELEERLYAGRASTHIEEAAALFADLEIAPAAWCAWSVDIFRAAQPRGLCGVAWVLSRKRITERHELFCMTAGSYRGRHVYLPPAHNELITAWLLMQKRLLSIASEHVDKDFVRACVELSFHPRSYDELVAEAVRQVREANAYYEEQVARGAFIW